MKNLEQLESLLVGTLWDEVGNDLCNNYVSPFQTALMKRKCEERILLGAIEGFEGVGGDLAYIVDVYMDTQGTCHFWIEWDVENECLRPRIYVYGEKGDVPWADGVHPEVHGDAKALLGI